MRAGRWRTQPRSTTCCRVTWTRARRANSSRIRCSRFASNGRSSSRLGQRLQGKGMTPDEFRRGVHATHDLTIHRPVRPPENTHHSRDHRCRRTAQARRIPTDSARDRSTHRARRCAPRCTAAFIAASTLVGEDKPLTTKSDLPRASDSPKQPRQKLRCMSRGASRTPTPSALKSGIRSTPTSRSRAMLAFLR